METSIIKTVAKYGLGTMLIVAGIGHLSFARKEFQAQVPNWVPIDKDDTVIYSGTLEIAVGSAIVVTPKKYEPLVGKITAGLFAAVFPGNIAQYKSRKNAFGLNSDNKRLARLFIQPLLIAWALASTNRS